MKRFMNKKVAAIAAAAGLTLGLGGAAFAYFTSTGNGTGSGIVGSPANWSVAQTDSSGTLYPCGSTPLASGCSTDRETLTFTITNNDNGNQLLTFADIQSAIDNDGGSPADIVTGGTNSQPNAFVSPDSGNTGASSVSGCEADWFGSTVTSLNGGTSNVDVAGHGGTATVVVTVGMEDANAVQNPCETAQPNVDLWVA